MESKVEPGTKVVVHKKHPGWGLKAGLVGTVFENDGTDHLPLHVEFETGGVFWLDDTYVVPAEYMDYSI